MLPLGTRRGGSRKMPRSTSGPKSSSGSTFGEAGVDTRGRAGTCRRHVSMLTRVLSAHIGIRLAGGGVPSVAHLFIASRLARKNIDVDTTLEKFCPWPRDGSLGCGSAKCCELDQQ